MFCLISAVVNVSTCKWCKSNLTQEFYYITKYKRLFMHSMLPLLERWLDDHSFMELTANWHSVISIPTCFPSTSKNVSFSTIISWFCIVTLLRLCGLRNSSAILATLKKFWLALTLTNSPCCQSMVSSSEGRHLVYFSWCTVCNNYH